MTGNLREHLRVSSLNGIVSRSRRTVNLRREELQNLGVNQHEFERLYQKQLVLEFGSDLSKVVLLVWGSGRSCTAGFMNATKPAPTGTERDRLWESFIENTVRAVVPEQYDFVQGLAKMDADLVRQESVLPLMPEALHVRGHAHQEQILRVHATLWVLGSYEIVRVLDERLNPATGGPLLFPAVKDLKRCFERVRMPLVKLKKAERASKTSDLGIALPQRSRRGCEWLLGHESISRLDLADALLRLRPNLTQGNPSVRA